MLLDVVFGRALMTANETAVMAIDLQVSVSSIKSMILISMPVEVPLKLKDFEAHIT
jgi:hypothetical protein